MAFLDSKANETDIEINATKINILSRRLRHHGLKCDFTLSALEYAEYEYPGLLQVSCSSIIIKKKSNIHVSRIIDYDKDDNISQKIDAIWSQLKEY